MGKGKWGESFLKTGLPLEHLTIVTLKTLGWDCSPHIEYKRNNREKNDEWFEIDCAASFTQTNKSTILSLLIECKYHDLSRYWFFLPHNPERWAFDDRFLNCAPFQTLTKPRSKSMLDLAPCSIWGTVVSKDGVKQDNAVNTAIQQIANGFVPYSLSTMFEYYIDYYNTHDPNNFVPNTAALIPVVVTNADIFRLNPNIVDLDLIRNATSPNDIADELPWTWCYFEHSMSLIDKNYEIIKEHKKKEAEIIFRYPLVKDRIEEFIDRPNWIAIVNIKALSKFADTMTKHFMAVKTKSAKELLNPKEKKQHKRNH